MAKTQDINLPTDPITIEIDGESYTVTPEKWTKSKTGTYKGQLLMSDELGWAEMFTPDGKTFYLFEISSEFAYDSVADMAKALVEACLAGDDPDEEDDEDEEDEGESEDEEDEEGDDPEIDVDDDEEEPVTGGATSGFNCCLCHAKGQDTVATGTVMIEQVPIRGTVYKVPMHLCAAHKGAMEAVISGSRGKG